MEFKKCERCGCFFVSADRVCANCLNKDNIDISKMRNFFQTTEREEVTPTFDALVSNTGISEKNLTRYLENSEFIENKNKIFEIGD